MLTTPNLLSLSRIPLALLFLKQNVALRFLAVILALITDGLDGFLARRYKTKSQLGAVLDPLMDKFFVFFVLMILLGENKVTVTEMIAMLSRDFAVILFGFYLFFKNSLSTYQFKSIWCGKITTVLQLFVLLSLTLGIPLPDYYFVTFILLGFLALGELYFFYTPAVVNKDSI